MGEFRKALRALKVGDRLSLPGGISVTRHADFNFRIHAPGAKTLNRPIDVKTSEPETAARKALDRSALTPHPKTLGGMDTTSNYGAVRAQELAARARDPQWRHIDPEDEEDLFTRPFHGDLAKNEQWLEDIRQEAQDQIDEIEGDLRPMDRETGTRDFRSSSDEEHYFDAQDRLERANKALKQLDAEPPVELPEPPKSVGTNDAPIGRLHTLADNDFLMPLDADLTGRGRVTAKAGAKFDVLRTSGGLWTVRMPDGRLAVVPKEQPYHRDRQTPFFHEDFFPEPPRSPGTSDRWTTRDGKKVEVGKTYWSEFGNEPVKITGNKNGLPSRKIEVIDPKTNQRTTIDFWVDGRELYASKRAALEDRLKERQEALLYYKASDNPADAHHAEDARVEIAWLKRDLGL